MAEPSSPTGEPAENDRPATDATRSEPELLVPPTEEELAETGEPTLEEIRAAAAGDHGTSDRDAAPAPAAVEADRPAQPADDAENGGAESRPAARAVGAESAEPRVAEPTPAPPRVQERTAPDPVGAQPVLPPADESLPPAPKPRSNRLVATAWVLLAAGLFEVLYFASIALLELLIAGPSAVVPQVQALIDTKGAVFAWLPVLFFLLLFELTVLLLNRAGRFAYVVASAVVALIVYVLSAVLVPLVIAGAFADRSTALQAFLSPAFILILIVAREVMLWTGFAIGARGTRVRRRNREARARYDEERADVDA